MRSLEKSGSGIRRDQPILGAFSASAASSAAFDGFFFLGLTSPTSDARSDQPGGTLGGDKPPGMDKQSGLVKVAKRKKQDAP